MSGTYSENELVAGCLRNDRIWQERLYKTYFKMAFQMCYSHIKDEDRCITILNNGFLKVFKKIDSYQHRGSLESWIRKIIYHCLIDEIRSSNSRTSNIELSDNILAENSILEEIFESELLKLLDELPKSTAMVFKLFATEGYSHDEIANKMNISIGTSKWHVSHAREILKQKIEKNYVK